MSKTEAALSMLVDIGRATSSTSAARRLASLDAVRARAGRFVEHARKIDEQPYARALDDAPLGAVRARAREVECDDVVLLGIGGSALGPRVIDDALRPDSPWKGKRLHVLDHLDPGRCRSTIEEGWTRGAHFCVVSKSGGTTETMALATILDGVARRDASTTLEKRATVVTNAITDDAGSSPLRRWANAVSAPVIDMPVPLGGRYSVLSAVGLLPAALLGHDVGALVRGGQWMRERLAMEASDPLDNPALSLAALLVELDMEHQVGTQVLMPYIHRLKALGEWFVQLWAESLGKQKAGSKEPAGPSGPVAGVGPTDQHSFAQLLLEGRPDKVLIIVDAQGDPESRGIPLEVSPAFGEGLAPLVGRTVDEVLAMECFSTELALAEIERPTVAIRTSTLDAETLGALFVLLASTTYLAGAMYSVNPYDQPGVQLIKRYIGEGLEVGVGEGDADVLGRKWRENQRFPRLVPRPR